MENVFIMDHPLIQHKISILRKKETGTNEFRHLVEEIAMLEGFEALNDLPLEEVEIETPIETLSWKYYQYVKDNPIKHWDIPTDIMYGSKDILQSIEIVRHFSMKFNCQLYIAKESEHSFMSDSDRKIVTDWIEGSI